MRRGTAITIEDITADPARLYTVDEAGSVLGKSPYTVRLWLRGGKIRGEKIRVRHGEGWIVTKDWRIPGTQILEALGESLVKLTTTGVRPERQASRRARAMACLD